MWALFIVVLLIAAYVYMIYRQPAHPDGVWNAARGFMRSQSLNICRLYIVADNVVILMNDEDGTIYDDAYKFQCRKIYKTWLAPFTGLAYYKVNIPGTIFTNMDVVINIASHQMLMQNAEWSVILYKNGEDSMEYFKDLSE
jgi:hypothetical protein